jgi:uncharacterized membrane protein YdfJ with MMPL/SSD domain
MFSTASVLLIFCCGFAFFSTDLTSEDTYRNEVESVEGQNLLNRSFPSGTTTPTDIVVADRADVPTVSAAVEEVFVLAFGVLLDTFLVRSVLVPAIALTLGDRFWWPSALSHSHPDGRVRLGGSRGQEAAG